ncbi:MAG: signal peptidase II [Candidatus Omnitrophica bacterium]|jgi:signal peptidase II|nr:signal peptidase II [Candidatus Omnitrophota bacterium]
MSGKTGKKIKPFFKFSLFLFGLIIADQLSKAFVSSKLYLYQSIPVIQNVFHVTLVHNRGAAFGLFKYQRWIFIAITLLVSFFIIRKLKKEGYKNNLCNFSLTLILAGGLGNLIDRLMFGYVVDFLDFRIWPVFNIADSAITAGAMLLGWTILITNKRKTKNAKL